MMLSETTNYILMTSLKAHDCSEYLRYFFNFQNTNRRVFIVYGKWHLFEVSKPEMAWDKTHLIVETSLWWFLCHDIDLLFLT